MPLYPMIDDRHVTPSSKEIHDTRVWNEESNRNAWNMYLGHLQMKYPSTLHQQDVPIFPNLPPTYTCVWVILIHLEMKPLSILPS